MRFLFSQFRDKTGIPSRQSHKTPVSGYPVKCNISIKILIAMRQYYAYFIKTEALVTLRFQSFGLVETCGLEPQTSRV